MRLFEPTDVQRSFCHRRILRILWPPHSLRILILPQIAYFCTHQRNAFFLPPRLIAYFWARIANIWIFLRPSSHVILIFIAATHIAYFHVVSRSLGSSQELRIFGPPQILPIFGLCHTVRIWERTLQTHHYRVEGGTWWGYYSCHQTNIVLRKTVCSHRHILKNNILNST